MYHGAMCLLALFSRLLNHEVGCKKRKHGDSCQAEGGGAGQAWCRVAQVGVAAGFEHGVDGGVGGAGQVHVLRLVAFCQIKAALHFDFQITCRRIKNTI